MPASHPALLVEGVLEHARVRFSPLPPPRSQWLFNRRIVNPLARAYLPPGRLVRMTRVRVKLRDPASSGSSTVSVARSVFQETSPFALFFLSSSFTGRIQEGGGITIAWHLTRSNAFRRPGECHAGTGWDNGRKRNFDAVTRPVGLRHVRILGKTVNSPGNFFNIKAIAIMVLN